MLSNNGVLASVVERVLMVKTPVGRIGFCFIKKKIGCWSIGHLISVQSVVDHSSGWTEGGYFLAGEQTASGFVWTCVLSLPVWLDVCLLDF